MQEFPGDDGRKVEVQMWRENDIEVDGAPKGGGRDGGGAKE